MVELRALRVASTLKVQSRHCLAESRTRIQVIGVLVYFLFFSGMWVCPAVKNVRGEYYLNGHWTIDFSRALHIASTVMHYDRGSEGDLAPELLHARGPTTEPLIIEVSGCACPHWYSLSCFAQQPLLCALAVHWWGLHGKDYRRVTGPPGVLQSCRPLSQVFFLQKSHSVLLLFCCPVRRRARLGVGLLPVPLGSDFKRRISTEWGWGRDRLQGAACYGVLQAHVLQGQGITVTEHVDLLPMREINALFSET